MNDLINDSINDDMNDGMNDKNATHIHLIGQGVISSLLAYFCQQAQLQHTQYVRSARPAPTINLVNDNDVELLSARLINEQAQFDGMIILALKAYDVIPALQLLRGKISENSTIVLCHNGMGTLATAQSLFASHRIIAATTSLAGYRQQSTIIHTAWGESQFAIMQESASGSVTSHAHVAALKQILPNAVVSHDMIQTLWTKLCVNAVINPLTAIHQCKNGELANPGFKTDIDQLVREIFQVAQKMGIAVKHATLLNTLHTVIYATAENYSSMHQDIAHQRRTEIDYINGYVVREADKQGVQAPLNRSLWEKVQQLEGRL